MSLMQSLMKQCSPNLWVGYIRNRVIRTQSYYTTVNVALLLVTTYTVREEYLKHYLPWFNFWWLLAIGIVLIIIVDIFDHKIVQPSEIAYLQQQNWKHKSPVRHELEHERSKTQDRLANMEKKLDKIMEVLNVK